MKDNLEGIFLVIFWMSIVSLFAMCVGYIIELKIDKEQKQKESMYQRKIDSLELVIKRKHETKK